ncbi:uncharacterized protein [Amphiura filiformis]|uniref:uncharacterized protein isoform X2 n=1 Tax=Amphiura filiformis TaxID=82378 RepID=UPI003B214A94
MGCASSAPPPQQNGGVKHHNVQQPQHYQQPPPQQPMHQPPPYQQAPPPQHQPPPQMPPQQQPPPHMPPQHQPPRQMPPPPPPQQQPPAQMQPPPPQQIPPAGPPPSQPPPQPAIQEEEEAPPKPVEINQEVVDSLLDLESKISAFERRNVIKQYELKANQINMLSQQVQGMAAKQQQLDAQTQKEYQDVVNLSQIANASTQAMMSSGQYAYQMNKEQEEYMQALNKSEIHKKELQAATRQLEALKEATQPIQKESEDLKQLYDQQDSLLASIFNGKYGSEKEFKLESNLDMMMEKKQRISVAKYKWTQSRQLISHAVNQMGLGVRRWNDAIQVPPQNAQLRYSCAAEARNNFVAALQNIASAQSYLSTIKFPYCTPSEMQTLNLAITHIFTDLLTADRHRHAMDCYVVVYKRSAALVQWFDFVINKTILKDNEKVVQECSSLQKELKAERMSLIKEKVRDKLGDEAADKIEIKEDESPGEDDKEPEFAALAVIDADTVSQAGELAEMKTESTELANAPTPLPLDELAPAPNMDDIFGNIEQLKQQHEEQQKEYEKQQEIAKARADQGLQDKLAQRRSRRRRMQANEAEANALGGTPNGGNAYYDMM